MRENVNRCPRMKQFNKRDRSPGINNCTICGGGERVGICGVLDNSLKKFRKNGAKALKQRTILFKLLAPEVISLKKEQVMSNRVLSRVGARQLTPQEVEQVAGGTTGCRGTSLHKGGPIVDILCDPS